MKIIIPKENLSVPEHSIRRAGYGIMQNRSGTTKSYVRHLDHALYPRFHMYLEDEGSNWSLNLHLDQRAPVYAGVTAHGGEYDGAVVEREVERIKAILKV